MVHGTPFRYDAYGDGQTEVSFKFPKKDSFEADLFPGHGAKESQIYLVHDVDAPRVSNHIVTIAKLQTDDKEG